VLSDFGEHFALDRSEGNTFHGLLLQSFHDVREIICLYCSFSRLKDDRQRFCTF